MAVGALCLEHIDGVFPHLFQFHLRFRLMIAPRKMAFSRVPFRRWSRKSHDLATNG